MFSHHENIVKSKSRKWAAFFFSYDIKMEKQDKKKSSERIQILLLNLLHRVDSRPDNYRNKIDISLRIKTVKISMFFIGSSNETHNFIWVNLIGLESINKIVKK